MMAKTQQETIEEIIVESCTPLKAGGMVKETFAFLIVHGDESYDRLKEFKHYELAVASDALGKTLFYQTPNNIFVSITRTGSGECNQALIGHIQKTLATAGLNNGKPEIKLIAGVHGYPMGSKLTEMGAGASNLCCCFGTTKVMHNFRPIDEADKRVMLDFISKEDLSSLNKGDWKVSMVPAYNAEDEDLDKVRGGNGEEIIKFAFVETINRKNVVILSWCFSFMSRQYVLADGGKDADYYSKFADEMCRSLDDVASACWVGAGGVPLTAVPNEHELLTFLDPNNYKHQTWKIAGEGIQHTMRCARCEPPMHPAVTE